MRGVLYAEADPAALATQAGARLPPGPPLAPARRGRGRRRRRRIPPLVAVRSDVVDRMLAGVDREARSPVPTPFTLALATERETQTVQTENVVAMVPGTDLADEFVVVSAHLDHIGVNPALDGDQINNGADDDGSGTVALLEIAEAFQRARDEGHGPRRSVLFLHVTGEEKGLLGSAYYADHAPVVPLAQTVADLNIDMIGRHDPEYAGADTPYVYILGSELISTDIDAVNARVNAQTGLGLDLSKRFNSADDPNQFFRRSDHWNFGKHAIPFIFYFTGTHEDYHRPGDEAVEDRLRPHGDDRAARVRDGLGDRQHDGAAGRERDGL